MIMLFPFHNINAETFEGSENDNYLYLEISKNTAVVLLKMDGKITSLQGDIKYYKNGNFKIIENRIFVIGIPMNDEIKVTIHDLEKREKTTITVEKLDTSTPYVKPPVKKELTPLEKFELSKKSTGIGLVVKEEKKQEIITENKTKIPRSEYTESEDKTIKILKQITKRIAYTQEFFFDIRIVDPIINGIGNDFWNKLGFVNDVEISSKIKDPNGDTLHEFLGNTTGTGHYTSPRTLFSYNSVLPGAYTLQVNSTKYFDDSETFVVDSITEEFFVYIPNDTNKLPCKFLDEDKCVEECPEGKFAVVIKNDEVFRCQNYS